MSGGFAGNRIVGGGSFDNFRIRCMSCGAEQEFSPKVFRCSSCGGPVEVVMDTSEISRSGFGNEKSMWRYRGALPLGRALKPVTMGEGMTPLVRLETIEKILGVRRLYAKFEGANPTGSFKDRGMSLAVSIASHYRYSRFIVASTGNTAASAAAYGARAGKRVTILLPKGHVSDGKLYQIRLYGAELLYVDGSFDDAFSRALEEILREPGLYPLNSINPWRLEGQKTLGYELAEDLGSMDYVFVPVGNGSNIYAIYKGLAEAKDLGIVGDTPSMVGVQASGSAPIARSWLSGARTLEPLEKPETVATAIRIGRPANWLRAYKAVERSRGTFVIVEDDEILSAQRMLARLEGIGCEPASAASLAGVIKLVESGLALKDSAIVLVLTGHALKDPVIR